MKLIIDKTVEFYPTKEKFIDSIAIGKPYAVYFEVNEDTAYFYALSMTKDKQETLDALHIYNVKNVTDSNIKSTVKIDWSEDYRYAILFINDYAHAIFDFMDKQGYNRIGFPPGASTTGWSKKSREWNQSILNLFRK